jgi:hypothetical protein
MTVPSLYSAKAFYDSTSALSGNPFCNNSTCGVSGTLRDCGLAAFPGGNIGYANRIEATGNWFTDILGTVRDIVTPTAANLLDTLAQKGFTAARKAAGYTMLEVVQIQQGGQTVFGQKAKKPNGNFVVILADGSEVPFTSEVASASKTVNPATGLSTGQTAGIAVAAIAAVALLYFISKRRR